MRTRPEESARQLLDVVPLIMRELRSQMRSRRAPGLSVAQFRALVFIDRSRGPSLSDVASHVGLSLPSTNRLVEGLIERDLAVRDDDPSDRRRIRLTLTSKGRKMMETARRGTLDYFARKLSVIGEEDRELVSKALGILQAIFREDAKRDAEVRR